MKRVLVPLLVALSLAASAPVAAQNAFEAMQATPGDAAYLGVVVPIDLGLFLIDPPPSDREFQFNALDVGARDALDWRNRRAALRTSDWLLRGFMLSAVIAPPIGNTDFERDTGNASLVGFEAIATTQLITGLIKHTVGRERPDGPDAHGDEAYASFFSGHTSMAFAGATMLTIYSHEFDWGGRHDWIVPATAFSLATFTGYLRIAGRKHWLTDVLAGAAVGTGAAYLSYRLRTQW